MLRNVRKPDKTAAIVAPQKCQTFDQAETRDEKASGKDSDGASADAARPSSSRSHKVRKRRPTDLPFGFDDTLNAITLPSPHKFIDSSYPSLRGSSSNPILGADWKNGSTPNLGPLKPAEPAARSSTSSKGKPRLDSISTSVTREASPVTSPKSSISATSKSPLGQFELTLNLPNEGTSLFGEGEDVLKPPEPLRIIKKSPTMENLTSNPPAVKPPSPPQSIRTDELDRSAVLAQVSSADADRTSSTTSTSQRIISADLDNEFRELSEELNYGPKSIPSPPASVRHFGNEGIDNHDDHDDDDPLLDDSLLFGGLGAPIIRTVGAKRDTLTSTISTPRRASIETLVEKHEAAAAAAATAAPSSPSLSIFSGSSPPPKSSARAARPAALNLNLGLRPAAADMSGPRSAPFPVSRPPWTPTLGQSPLAPTYRAPSAASGSRLIPIRLSRDSIDFELSSPQSPESPMLPLSGPLASQIGSPISIAAGAGSGSTTTATRMTPARRNTEPEKDMGKDIDGDGDEDPEERMRNFRFPNFAPSTSMPSPAFEKFPTLGGFQQRQYEDEAVSTTTTTTTTTTIVTATQAPSSSSTPTTPSSPPAEPFPCFSPLKRVATAPNDHLSNWPLPSPTTTTTTSSSSSTTKKAMTFPLLPSLEEPLEPLEPPRMPAALAESKTSRVRSFSRPWTPTNEPLKFEITNTAAATTTMKKPPIRSQTVTSPQSSATAVSSPRSRGQSPRTIAAAAPPPRSPPVATVVDRGLRSPGIVGDDFGGGFI